MDNIKEEELIIDNIIRLYIRQFEGYQLIFRDGQYTNSRTFNLKKTIQLIAAKNGSKNNHITITFKLLAKSKNEFEINITDSQVTQDNIKKAFCGKLKTKELPDIIKFVAKEKKTKKKS